MRPTKTTNGTRATIGLVLMTMATAPACGDFSDEDQEISKVTAELTIPGTSMKSGTGPSGVIFNGTRFMTYTGNDGRVVVVRQVPGGWSQTTLGLAVTPYGSSILAFNGELFLSWVGTDKGIHILRSSDGIAWPDSTHRAGVLPPPPPYQEPRIFYGDPALVAYQGGLRTLVPTTQVACDTTTGLGGCVTWRWLHHITIANGDIFDGGTSNTGMESTTSAPSALQVGSDFVMWWRTLDGKLGTKKWSAATGAWGPVQVGGPVGLFHVAPSVANPSELFMIERITGGNISPDALQFYRSSDGFNWSFVKFSSLRTYTRPYILTANHSARTIDFLQQATDSPRTLNFNWLSY